VRIGCDDDETFSTALEHFLDRGGTDCRLLGSERRADETQQPAHTCFSHRRRELLGVLPYLGFEGARKTTRHRTHETIGARMEPRPSPERPATRVRRERSVRPEHDAHELLGRDLGVATDAGSRHAEPPPTVS
jgi:hypothetical protein